MKTVRSQFWSDMIAAHNRGGCDAYQQAYFKHLAGAGPKPVPVSYGVPLLEAWKLEEEAQRQRAVEERFIASKRMPMPMP